MDFDDPADRAKAAYVSPSASLSGAVSLGKDSGIWHNATLRGDLSPVVVGERSNVQDGAVLHVAREHPCIIGDDVTIGHGAIVHGCRVGNRCLLGMGCIIMNGVVIGDECIIAAGALVPEGKQIPAGSLVMGSPARIIRNVTSDEVEKIRHSASSYVKLAQEARAGRTIFPPKPHSQSSGERSPSLEIPLARSLEELYSAASLPAQEKRYALLASRFRQLSGLDEKDARWYSTPGRTELCGNHTDHNLGRVLAGAIDLDIAAMAAPRNDSIVRIASEGYTVIEVDLSSLEPQKVEEGTSESLVRGMAHALTMRGARRLSGFDAAVHSTVPPGSGLSSSAAFEVLMGTIMADLWDFQASPTVLALCGKQAENLHFGKPSGLMDQMACASGSVAAMDFLDPEKPEVELYDLDIASHGYALVIVQTGGSHADLTSDYASIPFEMRAVANHFGQSALRGISIETLADMAAELRTSCGDRAFLRALHFAAENERADRAARALSAGNFGEYLEIIRASGDSSWRFLQNLYPARDSANQALAVAIALTENMLGSRGVARVHGGGFAGAIQAYVPLDAVSSYKDKIDSVFGRGATIALSIRSSGTTRISRP